MVIGAIFQANLNADKICIDMTYLPDPIIHEFWLTTQNQSLSDLWFKLVCNIPNWSLYDPADGKLGGVASGATVTFTPYLTRAKPASETTDAGSLKIEAYTDSGYTNKIGEAFLNVTVYIEDLENWTDVTKSDFDDGTPQGWTLGADMTISNEKSVEVNGYSARFYNGWFIGDLEAYIEKSMTLPNRNKVRAAFFLAYWGGDSYCFAYKLSILVDGIKVLDIPFTIASGIFSRGWWKVTGDLSAYKGQTITLRLTCTAARRVYSGSMALYFDRVVIAGKD